MIEHAMRMWNELQKQYPQEHQSVDLLNAVRTTAAEYTKETSTMDCVMFWKGCYEMVHQRVIERSAMLQMRYSI